MTYLYDKNVIVENSILTSPTGISSDASGRARVSQLTTLFDGKVLNNDEILIWETVGSGANTFANNGVNLIVTSGQYVVRQSKHYTTYLSGKSHQIEMTFDNFAPQSDVVKRFGYFSSSNTAPYSTSLDGFYIESSNNTIKLVVENNGNKTLDLDWTLWDNYQLLQNYNFNNFTVCIFDYLWLGGAILRLFFKNPNGGFIHAHTYDYAGTKPGLMIKSPNHPLRYEIRSSTGSGNFNAICSQVSSEGSISEEGKLFGIYNSSLLSTGSVGTIYALKGIRKLFSHRDVGVKLVSAGVGLSTSPDMGMVLILLNPTLSAPLTWTNKGSFEEGTATNQTVSSIGHVLDCFPIYSAGISKDFHGNLFSWLTTNIDGSVNEIILAYTPLTNSQSTAGTMQVLTY